MARRATILALLLFADGTLSFHVPSALPLSILKAHRRPIASSMLGRQGSLTPMKMSFVPDKKAMKENFAKVPDAIILRDPVQLTDATTKVSESVMYGFMCSNPESVSVHCCTEQGLAWVRRCVMIDMPSSCAGEGADLLKWRLPYQLRHGRWL